ncbi:MAG TPA: c-type cytochrome [Anaerolineales bacterium]|nr:c-type cytochrome [Anaerolineales bacterium]
MGKIISAVLGIGFLIGLSGLFSTGLAAAPESGVAVQSTATPGLIDQPQMVPTPDRLARPTLPANPSQADLGSQVYYMVCMACHGDQGQGLSPEWVEAWGLGEETCWQSKCHASNYPPEGFELPQYIPAVVSPGVVNRFANAQELYTYLQTRMPWQAPGTLSSEEYWQLTAYLIRANGIDPGSAPLDEQSAVKILMRPVPGDQELELSGVTAVPWFWIVAGAIIASAGIILLVKYVQRYFKPRRPEDETD